MPIVRLRPFEGNRSFYGVEEAAEAKLSHARADAACARLAWKKTDGIWGILRAGRGFIPSDSAQDGFCEYMPSFFLQRYVG